MPQNLLFSAFISFLYVNVLLRSFHNFLFYLNQGPSKAFVCFVISVAAVVFYTILIILIFRRRAIGLYLAAAHAGFYFLECAATIILLILALLQVLNNIHASLNILISLVSQIIFLVYVVAVSILLRKKESLNKFGCNWPVQSELLFPAGMIIAGTALSFSPFGLGLAFLGGGQLYHPCWAGFLWLFFMMYPLVAALFFIKTAWTKVATIGFLLIGLMLAIFTLIVLVSAAAGFLLKVWIVLLSHVFLLGLYVLSLQQEKKI